MITGKKTKVVATIGPATESEEMLTKLVKAGMNVARLNFSHGSHEEHYPRVINVRKVSEKLNTPVAILQDLCGPKIRIGNFKTESVILKEGQDFILSTKDIEGDETKVSINYKNLHKEIKEGNIIFINDGKLKLQVKSIKDQDIHCKVIIGGEIKGRRGVNLPGAYLKISSLTEKDKEDVKFGLKNEVDFMALSFVRTASDVQELKEILKKAKSDIKIVAKIETQEAIENLESIIQESDAIMVARGDLAVEIPAEEVPIIQKRIIKMCNQIGKPVITATQMLASMTSSSVPTRAEIGDIANAILDGTDAVMLSEETTIGKHPEEAVKIMTKVALHTEKHFPYEEILEGHHLTARNITDSISYGVVNAAHDLNAKLIVALTMSGYTARMISRYKPNRPILVITPSKRTYNRLALSSNCYPTFSDEFDGLTHTIESAKKVAKSSGLVKADDLVVITAGIPFSKPGNTNLLLVEKI